MKKLNEILLVDDSKGINTLNRRILQEMNVAKTISTALNGKLALDYLTTKDQNNKFPKPDIILLDINMPVMDGYQFLETYKKLDKELNLGNIIVMLTTSVDDVDIERSKSCSYVKGYQFKPLTKAKVNEILKLI